MAALATGAPVNGDRSLSFSLFISPVFPSIKPVSVPVRSLKAGVRSRYTPSPLIRTIRTASSAVVLSAAAALLAGRFSGARAETPLMPPPAAEERVEVEEGGSVSPLSQFLESHSEAMDALKALLQRKLEDGEDSEALMIVKRLASVQPGEIQWKFLEARLLNETGEVEESRKVFEEILALNPLSFEALFGNALLMDRCGEGEAVIERLEEALKLAKEEGKEKEARDVRLIVAQIQFLQKKVDEALKSYDELANEDPKDFRPYFCQGVIYSLLDRNEEARERFSKYHELSPKKFEVEGFLQTPLSRIKIFGSEASN